MKTEEFYEFKKIIEKEGNELNNPNSLLMYGNHNWILWLVTNWIGSSKMENDQKLKQLFSILSGNCHLNNFKKAHSADVL